MSKLVTQLQIPVFESHIPLLEHSAFSFVPSFITVTTIGRVDADFNCVVSGTIKGRFPKF